MASIFPFLSEAAPRDASSRTALAPVQRFEQKFLPGCTTELPEAANSESAGRGLTLHFHTLSRGFWYLPWLGITASEKLSDSVEALARKTL